ncbi:hypothetical protein AYO40_05990 [Planctomycetaceae bacterium SCGC AG-212-D15]|nr:hypothetical protein AYO40_05990 [Planctomycetaceae bacterium SCGC AG-212-D15]
MFRRGLAAVVAGALGMVFWASSAQAQYMAPGPANAPVGPALNPPITYHPMTRFWYYPYYYFPHNYWPTQGPKWPEPVGAAYQPPPAYMSYPPFREPGWRYEYFEPQRYYRGFHFWLDQF